MRHSSRKCEQIEKLCVLFKTASNCMVEFGTCHLDNTSAHKFETPRRSTAVSIASKLVPLPLAKLEGHENISNPPNTSMNLGYFFDGHTNLNRSIAVLPTKLNAKRQGYFSKTQLLESRFSVQNRSQNSERKSLRKRV